ncbi:MAG: hypothetical protein KC468_31470, partial [Myxococcales bacterium]|nr:hypothetical protein [Myxococcales bacterium]
VSINVSIKEFRRVSPQPWISFRPHVRVVSCLSLMMLVALASGCVEPFDGTTSATDSDTLSESGDSIATSSGVMTSTTTTTPSESTSSSDGSETGGGSDSSTEPVVEECGNGKLDEGEECDEGDANADDGSCTLACAAASCGDGLVETGVEFCDDGTMNGKYSFCNTDCTALGPHCGDGEQQSGQGEECDASITEGCLENCTYARSCQDIKDDGVNFDGEYPLHLGDPLEVVAVYCDLETDPVRGFTFLKVHLEDENDNPLSASATQAESFCANYTMHLLVTRDITHLGASFRAAAEVDFDPVGGGSDTKRKEYLTILGVQPKTPGESCVGDAFNSANCPEWEARNGGPFFVTSVGSPGQPATSNCPGCSPYFIWNDDGSLSSMEVFSNGGKGATSEYFMCDLGEY